MSMRIIKVASDSQSLLMLRQNSSGTHFSDMMPTHVNMIMFFCNNELQNIVKSLWTHMQDRKQRMIHNDATFNCDLFG